MRKGQQGRREEKPRDLGVEGRPAGVPAPRARLLLGGGARACQLRTGGVQFFEVLAERPEEVAAEGEADAGHDPAADAKEDGCDEEVGGEGGGAEEEGVGDVGGGGQILGADGFDGRGDVEGLDLFGPLLQLSDGDVAFPWSGG